MKIIFIVVLAMALDERTEMVQCPPRFPAEDVLLEGGRVQPARLSFAYIHSGDLYSEPILQGPQSKRVKGGWDIHYGLMSGGSKWLVCLYGGTEWSGLDHISPGAIQWWGKLDNHVADCSLKIRESKLPGSHSNWTATASCGR